MVTRGFKNKHKKIQEIGLQTQNLLTIVDSLINKIKKVVSPLKIHINSRTTPNVFVIELGFSIHIHKPTKVFICELKFNPYNQSLIQEQHDYHNSSQRFIHRSTISFKIPIFLSMNFRIPSDLIQTMASTTKLNRNV